MIPKNLGKEELIRLQKKYKTDQAIGELFGISRQAIHQRRTLLGVPSLAVTAPSRNVAILKAHQEGKSALQIAEKFDLSVPRVYHILQKNRVKKTDASRKPTHKKLK